MTAGAIDFPNSPSVNDTHTVGDLTWRWDGTVWNSVRSVAQGPTGATGPQGPQGNFGGITLDYTYSSNTAASDPGNGKLKFNNATLSAATTLYIDILDDLAVDMTTFLQTIDDSTSTIKGHYKVSQKGDASVFALYTIGSANKHTYQKYRGFGGAE